RLLVSNVHVADGRFIPLVEREGDHVRRAAAPEVAVVQLGDGRIGEESERELGPRDAFGRERGARGAAEQALERAWGKRGGSSLVRERARDADPNARGHAPQPCRRTGPGGTATGSGSAGAAVVSRVDG